MGGINDMVAPLRRKTLSVMVLAVLGVALFNSSKWVMLDGGTGIAMGVTYTSRFVGIAAFLVVAALFYDRLPSITSLLAVMVPFIVICLISSLVAPLLHEVMLGDVVLYATGVLYGIASTLFMLFYAHIFSSFEPRKSAVLFASAQLVTNCLMLFLAFLDSRALPVARGLFLFIGTAIILLVANCLMRHPSLSDHPLQFDSTSAGEAGDAACTSMRRLDWVFLIGAAIVFHTVFGVVAQVSSMPGDSFGLYEVNTDVAIIFVDILILVFCWFCGDRFGVAEVLVFAALLYAPGLALHPLSQADGGPLAGALVRGGFDCVRILTMALIARAAYESPDRTYCYFGFYRGISSVYFGRALGSFLIGLAGSQSDLAAGVTRASLWAMCVMGAAAFYLAYGKQGLGFQSRGIAPLRVLSDAEGDKAASDLGEATTPFAGRSALSVSALGDEVGLGGDDFSLRLEAFSARLRLSQREKEVLLETLHGQSRASVAKKLCLSPETVKDYLGRVYLKAGVSSKQAIIALVEDEPLPR